MEGIPRNSNTKDGIRPKNLTNGVHMFMPFLGPTCHLCNIQYRLPISSPKDRVFMMYIIRCILDAGWWREPSKIKNHILKVKRNVIKCKEIGKAPSYLSLGSHPVKYLLVMGMSADTLMRSLDLGRLSAFANFDTLRSSQSEFSSVYKAYIKRVLEGASL